MKVIKKWAKRNVKPNHKKNPAFKEKGKSKSRSHKRTKNGQQTV